MDQQEKPKRKSGPHFTKTQKIYQEGVLQNYGLQDEFKPSAHLIEDMAIILSLVRKEFSIYKYKPILSIFWERMRGK